MKIKVALIICLAASTMVACLAGCPAKVQVQHSGKVFGALEPGDCLTVALDYSAGSPEKAAELETSLSLCLKQALREAGWPAKFIPPDEFRRSLFPNLDITSAPRSVESFVSLLKAPQFRQGIDSLRVRYVVVIKEETWLWSNVAEYNGQATQSTDLKESFLQLLMAPLEGFCIALFALPPPMMGTYKKRTDLKASIIDLKSGIESGVVSGTGESTGYWGRVYIMPIFLPAVTESTTCQQLGREVVRFISSKRG